MSRQPATKSPTIDGRESVTLPTVRLLLIPALLSAAVGAVWAGGAAILQRPGEDVIGGLLAGVAAAAAVALAMLLIGPWRLRPLTTMPFVFLAGTVVQAVATLGGGFLLYSATRFGTTATWLCLVAAYWAGLFGLVRIYGSHMKRFAPTDRERSVAQETGAAESSE